MINNQQSACQLILCSSWEGAEERGVRAAEGKGCEQGLGLLHGMLPACHLLSEPRAVPAAVCWNTEAVLSRVIFIPPPSSTTYPDLLF